MSRIGKYPVPLAKGTDVKIDGTTITVKGPKGTLTRTFSPLVELSMEEGGVLVKRVNDTKPARAMHGTARAIIQNMVTGVTEGYKKELLIEGTGYRAEQQGKNLNLSMGYSHPVLIEPPEGVTFEVPKGNKSITITGPDKESVGQIAAEIRLVRPPEPYKGKGIRYSTERIRRKFLDQVAAVALEYVVVLGVTFRLHLAQRLQCVQAQQTFLRRASGSVGFIQVVHILHDTNQLRGHILLVITARDITQEDRRRIANVVLAVDQRGFAVRHRIDQHQVCSARLDL